MKKVLYSILAIIIIVAGGIFAVSIYRNFAENEKYEKMVAKKSEVPMWKADTKELVSEKEFKDTFKYYNDKGKKDTRIPNEIISSTIIPGLRGSWSIDHKSKKASFGTNWVPQGISENDDYFFISLYDGDHKRNSLIMVINKNTNKYVKSLIINSKSHVGGLAYDPNFNRLWWSNDGTSFAGLSYTTISNIKSYQPTEQEPIIKSKDVPLPWARRTSGIAYFKNEMFIVKYGQDIATRTVSIMALDKNGLPTKDEQTPLDYKGTDVKEYFEKMVEQKKVTSIASGYDRMQGLAISKYGLSLFTQSNGDDASILMSVKPNGETGIKFDYNTDFPGAKEIFLPPSAEQVSLNNSANTTMSIIFESGAKMYREEGKLFHRAKIIDRVVIVPVDIKKEDAQNKK